MTLKITLVWLLIIIFVLVGIFITVYYQPGPNITQGGYYKLNNVTTLCPSDSYCPAGSDQSILCPIGSSSSPGSTTVTDCISKAGYYFNPSTGSNAICTTGSYCVSNSIIPIPCPTGSTSLLKSTSINDCSTIFPGTFLSNGKNTPCPEGSYCPTASIQPILCPSNTTSYIGSSALSNCFPIAGYYNSGGIITKCPIGSYCPLGSVSPISCPTGLTTLQNGSIDSTACSITAIGYYSDINSKIWACPSGSTTYSTSSFSYNSCLAKYPTYYPENGQFIPCPSGYFCDITDRSDLRTTGKPKPCPKGFYCLQGEKTICPSGFTTSGVGATLCDVVAIGYYRTDGITKPCPKGVSTPGENSTSSTSCSVIANGYYKNNNKVEICPKGYFCSNPTTVPTNCPSGSYCPSGVSEPIKCPIGSNSLPGSELCTILSDGYYSIFGTVKICPIGYYCAANNNPIICPSNTICPIGSIFPISINSSSYFGYTGSLQYYTVPQGVTKLYVVVSGGAEPPTQSGNATRYGGGSKVVAILPVKPSQILTIVAGSNLYSNWPPNRIGGGDLSGIFNGNPSAPTSLIIAGGGGQGAGWYGGTMPDGIPNSGRGGDEGGYDFIINTASLLEATIGTELSTSGGYVLIYPIS